MTVIKQKRLAWLTPVVGLFVAGSMASHSVAAEERDPFEMLTRDHHQSGISQGVRDIENGDYQKGIERLKARLGDSGQQAHSIRAPLLVDLCVGYTMARQFEEARRYCDEAVENRLVYGRCL